MGTYMDQLKKIIENETERKTKMIKSYTFKTICNSLIKLLDEAKMLYVENKLDLSYIQFMVVVNIFSDEIPKVKGFNKNSLEYKELFKGINSELDIIEKVSAKLREKDALSATNSVSNLSNYRNSSNKEISSPHTDKKTIPPEKIYDYIMRMISNKETSPPQILLIDIRDRKSYENGHIHWSSNPHLKYDGVINIPIDSFYGMNMDINKLLFDAESKEINERKKSLIKNIDKSDLIVYYDDQSEVVNNQFQIISDILLHNNSNMKIKRPPVMLEGGYSAWVHFIQKTGKNLSEWIESDYTVDHTTRRMNSMNIGNQNINEVNKDKLNGVSSNSLSNNYYMQYANMGSDFVNTPTQPQNNIINTMSSIPMNNTFPTTPTNNLYSNINIQPTAPSINTYTSTASYPTLEDQKISMQMPTSNSQQQFSSPTIVQPGQPYAVKKFQLSSPNQNPTAPPYPFSGQPSQTNGYTPTIPPKPTQIQSSHPSIMPQPQPSPPSQTTSFYPSAPGGPPAIPARHNSISTTNKLPGVASLDSLSAYSSIPPRIPQRNPSNINTTNKPPYIPEKPISPNEIHNKGHGTVGLRNLGNTCYMNSILQCLNATTDLTRFFLNGRFRNDINEKNTLGTGGKLAKEYHKFLYTLWNEHLPVVSPTNIKEVISNFNCEFKGTEQHDSQEFLSCILDGLHEDLNLARKKSKSEIEDIRKKHTKEEKDEEKNDYPLAVLQGNAWKRYIDFNYSVIVNTFQGQYMSTLKCSRCNKSSTTFNSLMYLSVPIPSNATNLYHCLDKYIEKEYLKGNDSWSCPNCKVKVEATKQLVLSRLPKIMLIHLKRFYFQGPFRDKITSSISFPIRELDLSKYTYSFDVNKNFKYNLFAISNHYGTLSGGHYTAFVKDKVKNNWVSFDDSRISDISESKIMTNAAYILFYERIDN